MFLKKLSVFFAFFLIVFSCQNSPSPEVSEEDIDQTPPDPTLLEGQKAFLAEIKSIVQSLNKGVGFSYWGAEWVSFDRSNATTTGSSWENQALFDFDLKATPALEVFREN